MNREIKFRGKTLEHCGLLPVGSWVYGGYYKDDAYGGTPTVYILAWNSAGPGGYMERIKVDPKTVGQFTGQEDRNGKGVFEGDVLESGEDEDIIKGIVFFGNGSFKVTSDWVNIKDYSVYDLLDEDLINDNEMRVIGNISDNPELLEKGVHNEAN